MILRMPIRVLAKSVGLRSMPIFALHDETEFFLSDRDGDGVRRSRSDPLAKSIPCESCISVQSITEGARVFLAVELPLRPDRLLPCHGTSLPEDGFRVRCQGTEDSQRLGTMLTRSERSSLSHLAH